MNVLIVAPTSNECQNTTLYTSRLHFYLSQFNEECDSIDVVNFGQQGKDGAVCYDKNKIDSYNSVADLLNAQYDYCILLYKYNAYGGKDGSYLINLVTQLRVPLLTIIDGIISEPPAIEKAIVQKIAAKSSRVLAFSQLGIEFLEHYYKLNREKLLKTEFGVPVFEPVKRSEINKRLGIEADKLIISTGSMCAGSGFENLINALPAVSKTNPNIKLVLVNTNQASETIEYERSLKRLAFQRGVSKHLLIVKLSALESFIDELMNTADCYVSACINEKVLEDEFLSMAVSSGGAVLSTPTWYAKELLSDQKGCFYPFNSSKELAIELNQILRSGIEVKMYRQNALLFGAQNSWVVIAKRIKEQLLNMKPSESDVKNLSFDAALLPDLNLNHLQSLSGQFGFFKQSTFGIPDFKEGYDLRTNAMALLVLAKSNNLVEDKYIDEGINRCLAFYNLMQNNDGTWSSYLSVSGQVGEGYSSHDLGYVVWSLGVLYASCQDVGIKDVSFELLQKIIDSGDLVSVEAKCLAILGIAEILKYDGSDPHLYDLLKGWSQEIMALFPLDIYSQWYWFENKVSENMALVPTSLLAAYGLLKDKAVLGVAKRSIRFLDKEVMSEGKLNLAVIGLEKGTDKKSLQAEQLSTEAVLMVAMYSKLFQITHDENDAKSAWLAHNWYLGANVLGKHLYDTQSGGCYSVLNSRSVNPIMTTISTSAYWLSHFDILDLQLELQLTD
ncbi:glycosyltransferase [Carboxylicivirga sp. M1479]|uniref:glycosyltransferase n=1 Tax=Carboxylicivirga sp. M1479 TaxID=2594476 RepID=UPI001178B32B|nr:glycosyltransferase [Carboxylicivirga sp. M1479]TRX70797.1 glycosyltransferase [Carboxylicivirga sp. M1479]